MAPCPLWRLLLWPCPALRRLLLYLWRWRRWRDRAASLAAEADYRVTLPAMVEDWNGAARRYVGAASARGEARAYVLATAFGSAAFRATRPL